MPQPARARAAVGLTLMSTIERDHPEICREVRANIAESTRRDFDTVATLRWVSMQSHMDLSDRIRDAVGPSNNAHFWKGAALDLLNRPILGFVHSFTKLIGPAPQVFARVTPMIMPQLFTGIGTIAVNLLNEADEANETGAVATVSYRAFPSSKYTLMCFVEGLCGGLVSAAHVVGLEVDIRPISVDPGGDFELMVRRPS